VSGTNAIAIMPGPPAACNALGRGDGRVGETKSRLATTVKMTIFGGKLTEGGFPEGEIDQKSEYEADRSSAAGTSRTIGFMSCSHGPHADPTRRTVRIRIARPAAFPTD